MDSFPNLKAGVVCDECGKGTGVVTDHGLRCDGCGRFAQERTDYCAKHDMDYSGRGFPNQCLACKRERDVQQRKQEQMARRANPRMHSSIDAPRF